MQFQSVTKSEHKKRTVYVTLVREILCSFLWYVALLNIRRARRYSALLSLKVAVYNVLSGSASSYVSSVKNSEYSKMLIS